jgi:tripartite-type tricarboxylate transporter receptor subunit TctC
MEVLGRILIIAACFVAAYTQAQSGSYPNRAIRMIVPAAVLAGEVAAMMVTVASVLRTTRA